MPQVPDLLLTFKYYFSLTKIGVQNRLLVRNLNTKFYLAEFSLRLRLSSKNELLNASSSEKTVVSCRRQNYPNKTPWSLQTYTSQLQHMTVWLLSLLQEYFVLVQSVAFCHVFCIKMCIQMFQKTIGVECNQIRGIWEKTLFMAILFLFSWCSEILNYTHPPPDVVCKYLNALIYKFMKAVEKPTAKMTHSPCVLRI